MAKRLARGGVAVTGFDPDASARAAFAAVAGCQSVDSLEEMVHALPPLRVVWVMVPSGHPTEGHHRRARAAAARRRRDRRRRQLLLQGFGAARGRPRQLRRAFSSIAASRAAYGDWKTVTV